MEPDLIRMIHARGLDRHVHLVGARTDLPTVYAALDVVALTSRAEGLPFVLLEAMACGRPVVALAVGGVLEVVEVGTTGMLVGRGNWEGLAKELLALLAEPARLAQMGQAGRKRVEHEFALASSARRTASLYEQYARRTRQPHDGHGTAQANDPRGREPVRRRPTPNEEERSSAHHDHIAMAARPNGAAER
jgi:glycosyltransferase involved in cell wall biosynthesis